MRKPLGKSRRTPLEAFGPSTRPGSIPAAAEFGANGILGDPSRRPIVLVGSTTVID